MVQQVFQDLVFGLKNLISENLLQEDNIHHHYVDNSFNEISLSEFVIVSIIPKST